MVSRSFRCCLWVPCYLSLSTFHVENPSHLAKAPTVSFQQSQWLGLRSRSFRQASSCCGIIIFTPRFRCGSFTRLRIHIIPVSLSGEHIFCSMNSFFVLKTPNFCFYCQVAFSCTPLLSLSAFCGSSASCRYLAYRSRLAAYECRCGFTHRKSGSCRFRLQYSRVGQVPR